MAKSVSKQERHTTILDVIREHRVGSQETLRKLLADRGIDVTQATLSRDLRELRLVKVPGAEGTHYTLPEEWETTPPLKSILPTVFLGAEGTGNMLVVKTMTGGAQGAALAIDWEEWPEVLGTIAGVDTILVIIRDEDEVTVIRERLEKIAEDEG